MSDSGEQSRCASRGGGGSARLRDPRHCVAPHGALAAPAGNWDPILQMRSLRLRGGRWLARLCSQMAVQLGSEPRPAAESLARMLPVALQDGAATPTSRSRVWGLERRVC